MPRRGYRKGISDDKRPRPHVIKSRLDADTHEALIAESNDRGMTFSSMVAHLLTGHVTGQRVELPRRRGIESAAMRELCRIGNNVNQIAHRAHMDGLAQIEAEARSCLSAVNDAAGRLARQT